MADFKILNISNQYADYIVPYASSRQSFLENYEAYGAQILNGYYGLLHVNRTILPFPDLATTGYSLIPKLFTLLDTTSLEETGVLTLQRQPYLNLTGKGILLGFIDTGIDYLHPAFLNNANQTRIAAIWDQSSSQGLPPADYYYGTEFDQTTINQALNSDNPYEICDTRDTNGHGTALAGCACGSADFSIPFSSPAPDAGILVVKLKEAKPYLREYYYAKEDAPVYSEADLMMGLRYLAQKAASLNLPLVICIGLGTNQGDHGGNSPINNMLTNLPAINPLCNVITAIGNEGQSAHHFEHELTAKEAMHTMEIQVDENTVGFQLEIWGHPPALYSISIRSPLGEDIPRIPLRLRKQDLISFVLDNTIIYLNYELVQINSENQLILLRFQNPSNGIWQITVHCTECGDRSFHAWLPITGLLSSNPVFLRPNPGTTLCVPSDSRDVLTTGAYSAYNQSFYLEGSRGYTFNNLVKPDICSPGAALTVPRINGGYTTNSGTSIASAFLSGAVAQLVQWSIGRNPPVYLKNQELLAYLIRGASRRDSIEYPNPMWGYGTLNLAQIFYVLSG
ncbi:MAG: S8 family peptidase [Lachnospiraceae bacterium]|nr:S8 family peptidase [Lachnospiraceae bacterium]